MRYRPSHTVRSRQTKRTHTYERILRYMGLVLIVTALLIGGGWVLLHSDETSDLFAWLFDQPIPLEQPLDRQTSPYKKDEYDFRELELALSGALLNLQVSSRQVRETQSRRRQPDGTWRAVQRTIYVSEAYSLTQCNLEISRAVSQVNGQVIRADELRRSQELRMDITYAGAMAYQLTIIRDPAILRKTGRMALIINQSTKSQGHLLNQFLAINRPMTFGFIPWEPGVINLAAEAVRKNQEVIVHLPMEPNAYPRISPGKKAILVNQNEQTNRQIVKEALSMLSVAKGVSNYMGDKIRQTPEVMNLVLDEVERQNKYYIDGFGGPQPSGNQALRSKDRLYAVSWGALDEDLNQEWIAMRLDQASYDALKQGAVIVTASPHDNFLDVLSHKIAELELRGIEFVHVSDIVTPKESF